MLGTCCSMAQIILHLLVVKLKRKELRFVVLGAAEGLAERTPLFLGADLLDGSGIPSSNHCRIHARYARKGLATKLIFPAEVTFSGVTNIHSGAWFYNIQGLFQVAFEYHDSSMQVDIVSKLAELWKKRHSDASLPDVMQVNLDQLLCEDDAEDILSQLINPDSGVGSPSDVNEVSTDSRSSSTEPKSDSRNETSEGRDNSTNQWTVFEGLIQETIVRLKFILDGCQDHEEPLARALMAFLRMAKSELRTEDSYFVSLMDLVVHLECPDDLDKFKSPPWCGIDVKHNAFLCLVSEWLGKKFFYFNDAIASHLEQFKTKNFNRIHDLPPPQLLVPELFPQCMQVLVGHWIGLYDNKNDIKSNRKQKNPSSLNRDDHSYSTLLELENENEAPPNKKSRSGSSDTGSSYEDHNYSSCVGSQSPSTGDTNPPREDHTYVVSLASDSDEIPSVTSETTRKDHTYVATHSRKSRSSPSNLVTRDEDTPVQSTPAPSCPRTRSTTSEGVREGNLVCKEGSVGNLVVDVTKYPLVQLILEFINNALISGVAHVVYTRLLLS